MKKARKLIAVLLCFIMTCGMMACAKKDTEEESTTSVENQRVIIGTVAGQNVYLDEAKVYLRVTQLRYEQLYREDLGEELDNDLWETVIESTGKTLGETVKDEAMSLIVQTKIILAHADEYGITLSVEEEDDIARKAESFMNSTSTAFVNASSASGAVMNQIYTENAIIDKVYQKVCDGVVLEGEEAALRQINIKYVDISLTDGQTPISVQDAKNIAESIKKKVTEGASVEDAAASYGYSAKSASISTDGSDNAVKQTAMELKTGEMGIAQTDSTVYMIYCENENDSDAIASKVESMLKDKQTNEFKNIFAQWEQEADKNISKDLWEGLKLDFILSKQIEDELRSKGEEPTITDIFGGFDTDDNVTQD